MQTACTPTPPSESSGSSTDGAVPQDAIQASRVDPSTVYVENFEGWGTALAWGGVVVGGWPDPQRSDIADKLFSLEKGLGLNVIRYNIGGGPNAEGLDCGKMRPGGDVPGFLPAEGQWDWTADANQRWFLQAAKERGADIFLAFSDSPPAWMTISGCTNGSVYGDNNLKGYWTYKSGISGAAQETLSFSSTPGDWVSFRFNGTSLELYGAKNEKGGTALVNIDGGPVKLVTFYASEALENQLIYSSPVLPSGEHTFTLVVGAPENPPDKNTFVYIDRVVVNDSVEVDSAVTGSGIHQFDYHWGNYEKFADYLATVVKYFRDEWDISFQALAPFNEPNSNWWKKSNRQEGCAFDPPSQVELIKRVSERLQAHGLEEVQIAAADTFDVKEMVSNWNGYPPETQSAVSILSTHAYAALPDSQERLQRIAAQNDRKIWMTEYGNGTGPYDLNSMAPSLELAQRILLDMNLMRPTAWIYWDGLESDADNRFNNIIWGLITADYEGSSHAYWVTKQYYAFGNFTRFIRPGARVIDAGDRRTLAALSKDGKQLVLIASNARSGDEVVGYDLSAMNLPASAKVSVYRTSETENLQQLADIPISASQFTAVLAAKSITTFIIEVP